MAQGADGKEEQPCTHNTITSCIWKIVICILLTRDTTHAPLQMDDNSAIW